MPTLSKVRVFSVLDIKDGFHQMTLHAFGCYCYLCMPFGISSALEEFQRRMCTILQGLHGVEVVADDTLVFRYEDTEEECST